MPIDITEMKLTAYALGELFGPDRAAVEAHLAENEDAVRHVEEVRATARLISDELAREPVVGLLAVHHAAIERQLERPGGILPAPARSEWRGRPHRWAALGMSIAASVLIVGGAMAVLLPPLYRPLQLAQQVREDDSERSPVYIGGAESSATQPQGVGLGGDPSRGAIADSGTTVREPAWSRDDDEASNPIKIARFPMPGVGAAATPSGPTEAFETPDPRYFTSEDVRYPSGRGAAGGTRNQAAARQRGEGRQDRAVMAQLDRTIPEMNFDGVALVDVVEFLRDVSSTDIVVNWKALEAAGIDREAPVSARLHGAKFSQALNTALRSADPRGKVRFVVEGGFVIISTDTAGLGDFNTEAYARIVDNPFRKVTDNPLSTFSIDVDTASYSNVRRFLTQNQLPPPDAVRVEEMINYFPYAYAGPKPKDGAPFAAAVEVADCPWDLKHRLVRVGLKGKEIPQEHRPATNLVFLIDVSGSMQPENKLPLVKQGLKLLVRQLGEKDRVAVVVYAGSSGLVLPSTPGQDRETILSAIDRLDAGSSTNGAQGIELAYQTAVSNFVKGGTNRVILCTDGDFNVGVTDQGSLTRLIEDKAKSGVFLSVLGFGMGNTKDSTMELLADKGNGNYAYIDTQNEAKKVLVEQMGGTLFTIAKDVKIQVEFNPAVAAAYRLIGYENRLLAKEDFNDDKKDAGEIGAGHTVTALYEVIPAGEKVGTPTVDELKYQKPAALVAAGSKELLTLKLRYKAPGGDTSELLEFPVTDAGGSYAEATEDFKFTVAVAAFGMILRDSPHKGSASMDGVIELAQEGLGKDEAGYRGEFVDLVRKAKAIRG